MKKVLKQTLSVLLAVVMTFTITLPAFAESNELQTNPQTDISYESTNALGDLILDNYQETENESENAEYLIQSVTIEDKTATVELKNLDECTVVVAIYEKNGGKMLASGKADIEANESVTENTVSVIIDTDEMPEYFYVKAFLVDWENAPLCKYFETNEYTREFEEFMAKTTEDFEEDRVLNLDESEDNNFLVVSDEATVVEPEEGKNTVVKDDYTNGIYVIENADEQVKSLKKGDVFYYQYGEGENEYIIIKIENIKIDGDTVTLTASEIDEIGELFHFIKIDETTTQTTFDDSEMADGVTHESIEFSTMGHDVNIDSSVSTIERWAINIEPTENIEFGAELEGVFSAGIKFFYDFYLFEKDYYYLEISITSTLDVNVFVTGKFEDSIPLGSVGFNFLGAVKADAAFSFVFEAEAELEYSFSIAEVVVGASFDSINGLVNKTKSSDGEFENELTLEVKFYAGFEIKPEVKVLKYAEMSLSTRIGVDATITPSVLTPDFAIHDCSTCLDIIIDFTASVSLKIKIFEIINKETTFASVKINMLTAYYSNELGFGKGKCSNISYAVNITVVDKDKNPLSDVIINEKYKTDSNGKEVIYLPTGKHTITLQLATGEVKTKYIKVADNSVTITVNIIDGNTASSGTCGDNVTWTYYEDGTLEISGEGKMKDFLSNFDDPFTPDDNYKKLPITTVIINEGVTYIGRNAFCDCGSIETIIIPTSVIKFNSDAFSHMSRDVDTVSVYYAGTIEQWHSIENYDRMYENMENDIVNLCVFCSDGWTIINKMEFGPDIPPEHLPLMTLSLDDEVTVYSENDEQIATDSDVIVGNDYIVVAVKDENAEDLLASDNLLYIDQQMAESEDFTFEYVIDESITDYEVLIFGQKLSHQHIYDGVVTAPTCTEKGFTTYTCKCGDTYVADYVDEPGHSHISEITTPATHLKEGIMIFTCSCGDTYTEPVVKLPGHTYETVVTAPTCTEQGFTTYTCSCGDTYIDDYVDSTGHTDEIIPGYAATCTQTGLTDGVKCSVCGTITTEQKTIPVVSHNDGNHDGLCDACDFDFTNGCSHTCHSDNAFMQFLWRIISFLQKLFGNKSAQYCDCGVAHW